MADTYTPPPEILERYARVLVDYALGSGREGVRPGETVLLQVPESARPLLDYLQAAVLGAGGHPISELIPEGVLKGFIEAASDEQLDYFPRDYYRGMVRSLDHRVRILSEQDMHELEGADPGRLMRHRRSRRPLISWLDRKEQQGGYSWTVGLYGTPAMAAEAGMSLREYWEQIIQACFLDEDDPIAHWRGVAAEIDRVRGRLNGLEIEEVHVEGEGVDLRIRIGPGRSWAGGGGANIPSFEIFTSPDWRGTEGHVRFDQPLYHHGHLLQDVRLRFERGRVVESFAQTHPELLREMISADSGSDKLGEFSLTDSRMSRITRFMAETLYDENRGGEQGNFHIALGKSYYDAYPGDRSGFKKADWKRLGYNDSVIHTDIVSTTRRRVTATLPGGKKRVIYEDGQFRI